MTAEDLWGWEGSQRRGAGLRPGLSEIVSLGGKVGPEEVRACVEWIGETGNHRQL